LFYVRNMFFFELADATLLRLEADEWAKTERARRGLAARSAAAEPSAVVRRPGRRMTAA
jgi:hypothetical protein